MLAVGSGTLAIRKPTLSPGTDGSPAELAGVGVGRGDKVRAQGAIGEKAVAAAEDDAAIGQERDAGGDKTGGRDEAGVHIARCGEGADLETQDEGEEQTSDGIHARWFSG